MYLEISRNLTLSLFQFLVSVCSSWVSYITYPNVFGTKNLWSRGYTPWKGVSLRRSSQAARQIQRLATTRPTTLTDKDITQTKPKRRASTNAYHHRASSTYHLSLIAQGVGEWVA
jgi:hypothetical protein